MRCYSSRMPSSQKISLKSIARLCFMLAIIAMLCGISLESSGLDARFLPQQYMKRTEENVLQTGMSAHQVTQMLLSLPRSPGTSSLMLTNYAEDMAIREAILAKATQWLLHEQTAQPYYRASNAFSIFLDAANPLPSLSRDQEKDVPLPEGTLLTARILMGLWVSRRNDPQLSFNGRAMIHPDEILSWRGIQKHRRLAYYGSKKQFSDGYPSKQKQQVQQELALLSRYQLRGQHIVCCQGKMLSVNIDAPYLSFMPVEKQGKIAGYLISPGNWISSYEEHQMSFLVSVNRQLFQLNPRNDYLALRLAFYLTEYWRRHMHTGEAQKPFCMAQLLSSSMIPIEKANLTSRFVPRVEAALQKLYTIGLLGEPPRNLSGIDTTKAHWGKDWLASLWRLVPAQE